MDVIKQYWWLIAIGLVIAVLMAKRGGGSTGTTVQQIAPADTTQLAALTEAGRQADEQNRVSLVGQLLGYSLAQDQLAAGLVVSQNQTDAQTAAVNANLAYQNTVANYAYQAQLAALKSKNKQATTAGLLGVLQSGLNSFLPMLTGNNNGTSAGSHTITPSFNPNLGWGF